MDRWTPIARELDLLLESGRFLDVDASTRQDRFLEAAWPHLDRHGVSWAGFYLEAPDQPEDARLVMGPSRGGPACSPIGLHGACGTAYLAREALIVRDTKELGDQYIACDPRDRSELIIPVWSGTRVIGVLDLDSHEIGAFDEQDARYGAELMAKVGIDSRKS